MTQTTVNLVLALCLVGLSVVSAAEDPPIDLAERISQFRAASNGAASDTSRRLLAELRDELTVAPANFRGKIANFSTFALPDAEDPESTRGLTAMSWGYRGRKTLPKACDQVAQQECAQLTARVLRGILPNGDQATMIIVRRDQLVVYALTQDKDLVDSLRRGTEVETTLRVMGMFDHTVFAVLLEARQVSGKLVCPKGHRHPADSNFEFCPKCGGPLALQD